jgi:hypothetical protein
MTPTDRSFAPQPRAPGVMDVEHCIDPLPTCPTPRWLASREPLALPIIDSFLAQPLAGSLLRHLPLAQEVAMARPRGIRVFSPGLALLQCHCYTILFVLLLFIYGE